MWIELSSQNADNVLEALENFGFGSLGLTPDDFLESDQIIQLGYPPNRIDILTTLKGLQFEDCYRKKVQVEIEGFQINFIDIENLKKNKRATGRPQDLAECRKLRVMTPVGG